MWYDYQWIVITGGISSFITSYFIGANDVANSFGPSVGSKTLTLSQACILAGILEFGGAVLLGGEVSGTIAKSIARPDFFVNDPEFFAYGMLCSLISSAMWLYIATYYGYAVSTTHSIIGSIIGFSLVYGGEKSIVWVDNIDTFPYIKGLVPIIISWFSSPLISGILSASLFYVNKIIITSKSNIRNVYIYSPLLLYFTFFINVFFIFYKGGHNELKWSPQQSAWVSSLVSIGCVFISGIIYKFRNHKIFNFSLLLSYKLSYNEDSYILRIYDKLTYGVRQDIHLSEATDIPDFHIEEFDERIENIYRYIQIFSSSCVAFAHGANDVANSVGPFIGILYVYENMKMANKAYTPKWIYIVGGSGIVIGLFTYGYKLIRVVGTNICKLTPSRGYCVELATALTVLIASISGIPISTTHCVIGAEIGLGLVEGSHNLNWKILRKTFLMWIFTIIVTGTISATIFAQGVYSPSIQMSRDIGIYENNIKTIILNSTNNTDIMKKIIYIYDKQNKAYIDPSNITYYLDNICFRDWS